MGLIGVAMSGILYATGNYNLSSGGSTNVVQGIFNLAITVVLPILAINKVKSIENGFINFGRAFGTAFQVILISSIFIAIWIYVYGTFLEPNYQEAILQSNYEQWSEANMSEEDMDTAVEWTKKMTTPLFMGLFTILTSGFFGAIVSLILAAILQKKDPSTI